MAEDDQQPPRQLQPKLSKFFRKSKLGKIFKDDDNALPTATTATSKRTSSTSADNFNLNQDVVDFLKPSTEKSVPKLDIALARRWPDASELRQLRSDSSHPPVPAVIYTKPKRREGLVVAFVKTLPEIIGEGGDEAPDPPLEISRHKAKVSRSASDRRPGSVSEPYAQVRSQPVPEFQQGQQQHGQSRGPPPMQPPRMQDMGAAPPMRRTLTSPYEVSPAMQRKIVSNNWEDAVPHKPSFGRTPTGYSSPGLGPQEQVSADSAAPLPPSLPTIDTDVARQRQERDSAPSYENTPLGGLPTKIDYPGLEPALADSSSPVEVKKRTMRASEGQALRRMSMMVPDDLAEDEDDSGSAKTGQRSRAASVARSHASSSMHPGYSDQAQSPESVLTPDDPNPFADPKYVSQNPGERAAASQAFAHNSHPSLSRASVSQEGRSDARPAANAPPQTSDASQKTLDDVSHQYIPPVAPSRSRAVSSASRDESHSRPSYEAAAPLPRQAPSQAGYQPYTAMPGPSAHSARSSRSLDPTTSSQTQPPFFARSNGSAGSVDRLAPAPVHSRAPSRDDDLHLPPDLPNQSLSPYRISQPPTGGQDLRGKTSQGSLLGPGRTPASPMSRTSQDDQQQVINKNGRSPIAALRENDRPASAGSQASSFLRGATPPGINAAPEVDPAAETAYADFAARVAHMKGVFRLTAEREVTADKCTPAMWLRAGLWWFIHAKVGLEYLLRQQDRRGLLSQAHVDLGKAWWILVDRLEVLSTLAESGLDRGVLALRTHLKSLSLSMGRNNILPPEQSLIQGQDTRIWLEYPRFTADAAAVLGGKTSTSIIVDDHTEVVNPYDLLPLGDSREAFCYGRFPVEVSINTDEQDTDRVVLACMLTVSRDRTDYQTSLSIASQTELVSIRVLPDMAGKRHLTWSCVSWKSSTSSILIRLPRNFDATVRFHSERDFRAVWSLTDYAFKVERSLRAQDDEVLIHESRLAELQYADSAKPHVFPSEKLKGCLAMVYEKSDRHMDGNGIRRLHRGYRLLLITETGHKTLSAVSHDVGKSQPIFYEFLTDAAAGGTVAMVLRIRDETRQCRILLVFADANVRQGFYAALNGMKVAAEETVVGKMKLQSLSIEAASPLASLSPSATQNLHSHSLTITNSLPCPTSPNSAYAPSSTVQSDSLRLTAFHSTGSLTDRLNLGKGELLLRFPPPSSSSSLLTTPTSPTPPTTTQHTLQILRIPQQDATLSIDVRSTPPALVSSLTSLHNTLLTRPTIRTFSFPTSDDLARFHQSITGYSILYSGLASTFAISRRRMVVPIYKKLEARDVRIVVVSKAGGGGGGGGGLAASDVKVLAFMENFSACESLVVRVRETDGLEMVSGKGGGAGGGGGCGVRLVDAKFTLVPPPPSLAAGDKAQKRSSKRESRSANAAGGDGSCGVGSAAGGGDERYCEGIAGGEEAWTAVTGRFVNLEGLEYAEEHDDLTVGFEAEAERDAFASALPAATTSVSRGITLKRRI